MDKVLAAAVVLMPFITLVVEFVKPLLPTPADPEKQNAVVRVFTGVVALALSLGVYFFTNDAYSKASLGVTLATAGVAAGMATGLWHGATALLPTLFAARTAAPAPPVPAATPATAPIANDPLTKVAPGTSPWPPKE